MDETSEPASMEETPAEMPTDREPEEVASEDPDVGGQERRPHRHLALSDEDPRRDVHDLLADRNPHAGGEEECDHGDPAVIAEELVDECFHDLPGGERRAESVQIPKPSHQVYMLDRDSSPMNLPGIPMRRPPGMIRRILVATDSLKGTCTAVETAAAIGAAISDRLPGVEIDRCPLGDGGEGTLEVLAAAEGLRIESRSVTGPRRDRPNVDACFGVSPDRGLAVVELAEAAGLNLVAAGDRDPRLTGTGGVGELLDAARARLAQRAGSPPSLLLTVGGSGTVDGGVGALSSLGIGFIASGDLLDAPLVGADLSRVEAITVPTDLRTTWAGIDLRVAVDVRNPLTGPTGAARTFGPQKGADPATIDFLERGLERWVEVVGASIGVDRARAAASRPGAGAAGGIAFALHALFDARIESGFDLVADHLGLDARVRAADLVVTSEGRLDAQSMMGKATGRLLELATRHDTPIAVIPGSVGDLPIETRSRFHWIRSLVDTCGPVMASTDPRGAMEAAVRLQFPDPLDAEG